jgi:hypothetical protein
MGDDHNLRLAAGGLAVGGRIIRRRALGSGTGARRRWRRRGSMDAAPDALGGLWIRWSDAPSTYFLLLLAWRAS